MSLNIRNITATIIATVVAVTLLGSNFNPYFESRNQSQSHNLINSILDSFEIQAQTTEPTRCDYVVGQGEQFATVNDALAQNISWSGKTICVRNNKIYNSISVDKSGTAGSQLTIRGHPQNTGKYQIESLPDKSGFAIRGAFILARDFEVLRSPSGTGVTISEANNVVIKNFAVRRTWNHGVRIINSEQILVDGCEIEEAVISTEGIVGENMSARNSKNVVMQNCFIHHDGSLRGGVVNSGDGSSNITIRNNELFVNQSNNLHLGSATDVLYENNIVSTTCGNLGYGAYRLAERYPDNAPSPYTYNGKNITFRNNLIVGMSKGMTFDGCEHVNPQDNCPFDNVVIANNTVVGIGIPDSGAREDREYALDLDRFNGDPVSNVRVQNNIFHSVEDGEEDLYLAMTGDYQFSGNLWSDLTNVPAGDRVLNNFTGVFSGIQNLNSCLNARIDPKAYCVSGTYTGKGADCTKLGTGRGGEIDLERKILKWNYTLQDLIRIYEDRDLDKIDRSWGKLQLDPPPSGTRDPQLIYCKGGQPSATPDIGDERLYTAIGCIPISSASAFTVYILGWALSIGGGITFLLIIFATYKIMTSNGDPKKLQSGKELLTACISGLLLIIFSALILRVIGSDIFQLPGL